MSGDLLLIGNSTVYGRGYLDHVAGEVRSTLGKVRNVLFFPYALHDMDSYVAKAAARFKALGYELTSIHTADAKTRRTTVEQAASIFIGGGNTFRLLNALYRDDLLGAIRAKVAAGTPFIGSSAGSIVAGPTIKTTKDMPILQPPSFDSLGIFAFQISPHFLDPDPNSKHMGETQEERILQFLEENSTPVIGLREGSFIRQAGGSAVLKGPHTARIFRRDHPPIEIDPGADLTKLLGVGPWH
jgi:dipeptidase E